MTRCAVYAVPGLDQGAPTVAVRLRDAVESWYSEHPGITVDARRYGFHATLKAPFELASDVTISDLAAAVSAFASTRRSIVLPDLRAASIGSFRALVLGGDAVETNALAADVVRTFEPFRAPLTDSDIARRRPERLTPRQREILHEYGYPFALDEFRFHLTLTDALDGPAADIDAAIGRHFAAFDGADIPLTSLAVFIEPDRGQPFGIHSIHPFQEIA
ncbi:DUF1045 domain-containing protein [Microbacterium sp. A93]|uniref:DUF1045 domain-containing protein n=1 Tax=Microbacterium sp. A93 TaxID=3450716 RepID=UPI003F427483